MIGKLTFTHGGKTYADISIEMEVSAHSTFHTNAVVAKVAPRQVVVFGDSDGKGLDTLKQQHPECTFIAAKETPPPPEMPK